MATAAAGSIGGTGITDAGIKEEQGDLDSAGQVPLVPPVPIVRHPVVAYDPPAGLTAY